MLKRNFRDRHAKPWCLDEPLGLPMDMQAPWAGTEGEVKVSLLAFPVYGGCWPHEVRGMFPLSMLWKNLANTGAVFCEMVGRIHYESSEPGYFLGMNFKRLFNLFNGDRNI